MRKLFFVIVILWLIIPEPEADAQIMKKLQEAGEAMNDPLRFLKNTGISALKKSKAKMDSASFGFAISFSDNAGLFENKETFDDMRDGILILFNNDEDETDVANEYKDAGEMAYAANLYRIAETYFLLSRVAFEVSGLTRHVNYAGVISDLGLLNHTMGRYGTADVYTNEALELRKEIFGEESLAYAASLNNLAVLYKDQGEYTASEKTMDKALDVAVTSGNEEELLYAIMLNNKAMLFQELGRTKDAERLLQESITLSEEIQGTKSSNHQRLMTNLAILYQETGRYEEAEKIFLDVIKKKEKKLGKRHPDYAHMLNNLASLYVIMGQDEEVEDLLLRARAIYQKKFSGDHPSFASNSANLGNFYRYKSRNDEAEEMLTEALDIRGKTLGQQHPDYVQSKEDLALLYWQTEDFEKATTYFEESLDASMEYVQEFFPAMSEAEKTGFWDKVQPRFFRYFAFVSEAYKSNPQIAENILDYRLATKSILLSSSQRIRSAILDSGDEELVSEYQQWIDIKESLAGYYTYSKEEISSQKVNLDSMERLANRKEKFLSEQSEIFREGFFKLSHTFSEISSVLEADEVSIEIMQIPVYERTFTGVLNYYAIITIQDSDYPELVNLGDSKELDDKYFKYYRNATMLKLEDKYSYEKFWMALGEKVKDKKQVYISKDGIYNQVNLNTLKNEEGYVIDRWNIELLTTTNDLIEHKSRKVTVPENPVALFGYPDYGSGSEIGALPGTKLEVEAIDKILKAEGVKTLLFQEGNASETNVKNMEKSSVYHFATHGFFLPDAGSLPQERLFGVEPSVAKENPMLRSGILFAGAGDTYSGLNTKELSLDDNGVLTAYEAMNLNMEGVEFVVLSACETGLGDVKTGEGVYGLQRAFLVAGANRIIMSLWKVNDAATQELMTHFYKNLISMNYDVQSAFKVAQLELKKNFPEPYYWGAFVLIER